LAAALGFNVLVITLLATTSQHPSARSGSPPIELRLLPPMERPARLPRQAPEQARPVSAGRQATSQTRVETTSPVQAQAASVAPDAPIAQGKGEGPPAAFPAPDLGRVFRTNLACDDPAGFRLTAEERARCAARLGDGAQRAAFMPAPIDRGKRAWFDATHAAYQGGGRLPVPFACLLGFGSKRKPPPHSLKFGKLPCYAIPPQGILTEELGVEPPEHVEAR
jgi:hypothetical protein